MPSIHARHSRGLRRKLSRISAALVAATLILTGCQSAPSVIPLLEIVGRSLETEAQSVNEDRQRDQQYYEQMRDALRAAFEADLHEAEPLDPEWVTDAAEVYAAAREALAQHESSLDQQRLQRMDNLQAALEAQQRTIRLIEQTDAWVARLVGMDMWNLGGSAREE